MKCPRQFRQGSTGAYHPPTGAPERNDAAVGRRARARANRRRACRDPPPGVSEGLFSEPSFLSRPSRRQAVAEQLDRLWPQREQQPARRDVRLEHARLETDTEGLNAPPPPHSPAQRPSLPSSRWPARVPRAVDAMRVHWQVAYRLSVCTRAAEPGPHSPVTANSSQSARASTSWPEERRASSAPPSPPIAAEAKPGGGGV